MILTPALLASHDYKSYVEPYFIYLECTNAVALFMMPLATLDTDGGVNRIMSPKKLCYISFQSSRANKWNGGIDDTGGIM